MGIIGNWFRNIGLYQLWPIFQERSPRQLPEFKGQTFSCLKLISGEEKLR